MIFVPFINYYHNSESPFFISIIIYHFLYHHTFNIFFSFLSAFVVMFLLWIENIIQQRWREKWWLDWMCMHERRIDFSYFYIIIILTFPFSLSPETTPTHYIQSLIIIQSSELGQWLLSHINWTSLNKFCARE